MLDTTTYIYKCSTDSISILYASWKMKDNPLLELLTTRVDRFVLS